MKEEVAAVRRFNRFYTEVLGLLQRTHLESDYSLTEVRLLFELNEHDGATASEIGHKLRLDAGYLSRMLKIFERHGLIVRRRRRTDARQVSIHLTSEGKQTFAHLNERATEQIQSLLEPLRPGERSRLARNLEQVQKALEREERPVDFRAPLPGDMGWVVERHGALYAQEYGWNSQFEALVARIVADFLEGYRPDLERCWVAERDGERAGCVFLVRKEEGVAQLRLLLVEPWARGMGLGSRLVAECEAFARRVGYRRITLWTNDALVSARRIYEGLGYSLVSEEKHSRFGPEMRGQEWEKALR